MNVKIQDVALYVYILFAIAALNSCTTETVENYNPESEIDEISETETTSNFTQIDVNGTTLTVEQLDNGNYALGDMIFTNNSQSSTIESVSDLSAKSLAVGRIGSRWPNNEVPYYLDNANTEQVEQAIRHVELFTNMRFYETDGEDPYALTFYGDFNACNASIGYVDESEHSNFISTGGCNSVSSIVHEIGHSLGLWHEQSRADRDDYIQVNLDNTNEDFQFQIYGGGSDGFEYTEFDFNSIMLYDSYSTSTNGRPVMTKLDGSTFDSNTSGEFSDLDIQGLNDMYPEVQAKLFSIMGGNGLFVSSENGRKAATCNRSAVGTWEKFIVTPIGQGTVLIKDNKNKKYLTYNETENTFKFDSTNINDAESFAVTEYSYGQSDLFHAQWYYTLKPENSSANQNLNIDEGNNNTLTAGIRDEFRIIRIN